METLLQAMVIEVVFHLAISTPLLIWHHVKVMTKFIMPGVKCQAKGWRIFRWRLLQQIEEKTLSIRAHPLKIRGLMFTDYLGLLVTSTQQRTISLRYHINQAINLLETITASYLFFLLAHSALAHRCFFYTAQGNICWINTYGINE